MAKINIKFNNANYELEEAALASSNNSLKNHLLTTMAGTGTAIILDDTIYNVDSAKLSTATNAFTSHLGTIAGSGHKVIVGGVEYSVDSTKLADAISDIEATLSGTGEERLEGDGAEFYTLAPTALSFRSTAPLNELQEVQINGVTVDPSNYTLEEGSTIVTFPIEYLKTLNVGNYEVDVVSDSKTVKGGFTVAAPELNEYGFYYNQPYTGYVEMLGCNTAFFVRDNGTVDFIFYGGATGIEQGSYTYNNNIFTFITSMGDLTLFVLNDGLYCNELGINFILDNTKIVADEHCIYAYDENLDGYAVHAVVDSNKLYEYNIITGINDKTTVGIKQYAFQNCRFLKNIKIPNSIRTIERYAFNHCESLTSITIPNSIEVMEENVFEQCFALTSVIIENGVTSISKAAFSDCWSLASVSIPNSVTSIEHSAFSDCKSLTSITIPNSVTSIGGRAFAFSQSLTSIIFDGTISQWNAITLGEQWNLHVPATYVQCSDGQVSLV